MTKLAQNTFNKGLRIDNDASLQEQGTYRDGHNIDISEIGAKLAALNIKGSNLAANITDTELTDNSISVLGAYRTSADIDRGDGFVQREGIILFVKGATPPPPPQALQPIVSPEAGVYSGFVTVTVTNQRSGETIYYTTDGSVPTESSTIYGGIVVVNANTTLRFRAFSPIVGVEPSEVTTVSYVISALTVTISPAAGTYLSSRVITLGASSVDAVIYYTLDGSTPDNTKTQYTSPFTLTENTTVKAIAIIPSISTSAVAESVFGIQLIAPELTANGTAINEFVWSANNPNPVGDIRYTTDGSTPTSGSALYTTPVTVTATTTIKAAVFSSTNVTSDVTERTYTVQCAAPTITPNGGIVRSDEPITLATTTSGATIRYTTNGDEPTSGSAAYTTPIFLSANTTLKAKTFKTGLSNSDTTSAIFGVSVKLQLISPQSTGSIFITTDGWVSNSVISARPDLSVISEDGACIFRDLGLSTARVFRTIDSFSSVQDCAIPATATGAVSTMCGDKSLSVLVCAHTGSTDSGSNVYFSYDMGDTFTRSVLSIGGVLGFISSGASTNDGRYVIMGGNRTSNPYAWLSSDYGQTFNISFTVPTISNSSAITSVAINGDGSIMYIGVRNASSVDFLYKSTNFGATWSQVATIGSGTGTALKLACDETGLIVFCTNSSGGLLKSTDGGATWGAPIVGGSPNVSVSLDGMRVLYANVSTNSQRYSSDGGATFTNPVTTDSTQLKHINVGR